MAIIYRGRITGSEGPIAGALVRLIGDEGTLGDDPRAALDRRDTVVWVREMGGFDGTSLKDGNLWNAWLKLADQEVAALTYEEFKHLAPIYNPTLAETGGLFQAEQTYYFPENRSVPEKWPAVAWDRPLAGFDGNLWECWKKYVAHKTLGLSWQGFRHQAPRYNPELTPDGGQFQAAKDYLLPRSAGHDAYYRADFTDGRGQFELRALSSGVYRLEVSAAGFVTRVETVMIGEEGLPGSDWMLFPLPVDRDATGFVQAHGREFRLQGKPFRFIGVNMRGLAHYGTSDPEDAIRYTEEKQQEQQLHWARQMGVRVIRVFLASRHAGPAEIERRLRRVLTLCRTAPQLYVIPAFTDLYQNTHFHPQGDSDFYDLRADGYTLLNHAWFDAGYQRNYWALVRHVVTAFRDDPNIFAWEIGNELKAVNNPLLFMRFIHDVAGRIRKLDPNHMIATGMISTHHVHMAHDLRLQHQLYGSPFISLVTVHAYNGHLESEKAAPDDPRRRKIHKNDDSLLAAELNKPFIVEEAGFDAGPGENRGDRVRNDMDEWFKRGAQGYMQWGFLATDFDNGDGDAMSGMDRGTVRIEKDGQKVVAHHDWDNLFNEYRNRASQLA
jgi:mannan endo-1,4-beta-mannosidase